MIIVEFTFRNQPKKKRKFVYPEIPHSLQGRHERPSKCKIYGDIKTVDPKELHRWFYHDLVPVMGHVNPILEISKELQPYLVEAAKRLRK